MQRPVHPVCLRTGRVRLSLLDAICPQVHHIGLTTGRVVLSRYDVLDVLFQCIADLTLGRVRLSQQCTGCLIDHKVHPTLGRVRLSRLHGQVSLFFLIQHTSSSTLGRVRLSLMCADKQQKGHQKSSTSGRVEPSYYDVLLIKLSLKRQQGIAS